MMKCLKCDAKLVEGARFCHVCGTLVPPPDQQCLVCEAQNPNDARFCFKCGHELSKASPPPPSSYSVRYPLNFSQPSTLARQLQGHFVEAIRQRLQEESKPSRYKAYLECFYQSGFSSIFDKVAASVAERFRSLDSIAEEQTLSDIDEQVVDTFDRLLDRFMIRHAQHLNEVHLPEEILYYENSTREEVNLSQMILHYLAVHLESNLAFFTNLTQIPINKLRHASRSFLFPEQDEKIYFICDQSVFGSCREGFAFTEQRLYWKAHFNKAASVYYTDLEEINLKNWLLINGLFFHVNRSVNVRMFKLLKKLRTLYHE